MTTDPIGLALALTSRLASQSWLDRFGLRRPVERLAYHGTRTGFHTLGVAGRQFRKVGRWLPRQRLPARETTDLFDLNLDQDQQMIVDSLARFARDQLRPAAAAADEAGAMPEGLRQASAGLGLPLYAVPAAFGGVAETQSPVTSTLLAEQLAWGDMALAVALLAPFSVAQAISRWGTGEQQSRYLPAFCEDTAPLATMALDEPRPLFDPWQLETRAARSGSGYRLDGLKNGVVLGGEAELLLVAAMLDGKPRLFVTETAGAGIQYVPDPAMGLRASALATLRFDGVELPSDALLGGDDFDYQAFLDRGAMMRCALAVGTAQAVLDYVIPYCNERQAFGEPISHRQAVAFTIANLAIETDSMRLLTWRAASRAEQGLEHHRETALASLLCQDKAMEIGSHGVQLLGGHGYVKEHPVERWYRDLRSVATQTGGMHA